MKDISDELSDRKVLICDACFSAFEATHEEILSDVTLCPICTQDTLFTIDRTNPLGSVSQGFEDLREFNQEHGIY